MRSGVHDDAAPVITVDGKGVSLGLRTTVQPGAHLVGVNGLG